MNLLLAKIFPSYTKICYPIYLILPTKNVNHSLSTIEVFNAPYHKTRKRKLRINRTGCDVNCTPKVLCLTLGMQFTNGGFLYQY